MTDTANYKILYTHFHDKEDGQFTHYCDDGLLREGSLNTDFLWSSLPQWSGFSHSGEMKKSDKDDLLSFANRHNYGIYLYWMIWLYKSEDLYTGGYSLKQSKTTKDINYGVLIKKESETDYRVEFDDLYEEFTILEDNYDMLKESYQDLLKKYNDLLRKHNKRMGEDTMYKEITIRGNQDSNCMMIEQDLGTEHD